MPAPPSSALSDDAGMKDWMNFIRVANEGTFASLSLPVSRMASLRPRSGVEVVGKEGVMAKAGPDGKTFNPRRVQLDPASRAMVYFDPDSDAALVRQPQCLMPLCSLA